MFLDENETFRHSFLWGSFSKFSIHKSNKYLSFVDFIDHTRVSARKNFMGGTIRKHKFAKKGICLLNTFLKDFTKMPIKKNTVLQFDGGDIPPLPKS